MASPWIENPTYKDGLLPRRLLLLLRRAPRALESGPSERQHLFGVSRFQLEDTTEAKCTRVDWSTSTIGAWSQLIKEGLTVRRQALIYFPQSRIKAHRPLGMTECPLRCRGSTALDSIFISANFSNRCTPRNGSMLHKSFARFIAFFWPHQLVNGLHVARHRFLIKTIKAWGEKMWCTKGGSFKVYIDLLMWKCNSSGPLHEILSGWNVLEIVFCLNIDMTWQPKNIADEEDWTLS